MMPIPATRRSSDRAHHQRERVENLRKSRDHRILGQDGDVLFLVAIGDQVEHRLLGDLEVRVSMHLGHDSEERRAIEHPHSRADGHYGDVVEVDADTHASLREHTDHSEAPAADADDGSDWIADAEELVCRFGAQDEFHSAAKHFLVRQELTASHFEVAYLEIGAGGSEDRHLATAVTGREFLGPDRQGRNSTNRSDPALDRQRVVQGQIVGYASDPQGSRGLGLAG